MLDLPGPLIDQDRHVLNRGMLAQHRLNLAQLQSKTADLDLLIAAPGVDQCAVGPQAGQIAAPVHASARLAVRVGDEAMRGQPRTIQVAAGESGGSDVHFAFGADGNRLEMRVENVDSKVRQAAADGTLAERGRRAGVIASKVTCTSSR
jgi:hypothetical protein